MSMVHIIFPYRYNGCWVFDDKSKGLLREPLIQGIDKMLDLVTEDIPSARAGFKLLFSEKPFPGYTLELEWERKDSGWNSYRCKQLGNISGQLCPNLACYFESAPKKIFAKATAKN